MKFPILMTNWDLSEILEQGILELDSKIEVKVAEIGQNGVHLLKVTLSEDLANQFIVSVKDSLERNREALKRNQEREQEIQEKWGHLLP